MLLGGRTGGRGDMPEKLRLIGRVGSLVGREWGEGNATCKFQEFLFLFSIFLVKQKVRLFAQNK